MVIVANEQDLKRNGIVPFEDKDSKTLWNAFQKNKTVMIDKFRFLVFIDGEITEVAVVVI